MMITYGKYKELTERVREAKDGTVLFIQRATGLGLAQAVEVQGWLRADGVIGQEMRYPPEVL